MEEGGGMKKIALFLGAGASVPYGMPTTKGLMENLEGRFPRPDLLDKYPDVEHILQILDQEVRIVKTKAGNHHCSINNDFRDNLSKTILSKLLIDSTIRQDYKWDPSYNQTAEEILGALFKLAMYDRKYVTIFTTNYDSVIERYTENPDRRMDLINGFKPHPTAHAHVWKESFTGNNDMPIKVFLYKLHGSLSWQKIDVGGEQVVAEKPEESAPDSGLTDAYIRPSLNIKKEARQVEPYAAICGRFVDLLPSFDVCIVIGCSFRDKYIFKEFTKFIQHGTLISISPTSSGDFMRALKRKSSPANAAKWKEKPLCSMSYRPGEKQRFYAVQQELGGCDMDAIVDTINRIITGHASPHIIGSIVEPST